MEKLVRLVIRQVDYLYGTELSYVTNVLNFDLSYESLRSCIETQIVDGVFSDSFVSYVRCLIQTYGEYPAITGEGEVTFVDAKMFYEPYTMFCKEFDSRVASECAIMASVFTDFEEFGVAPKARLKVLAGRVKSDIPGAVYMAMQLAKEYSTLDPIRLVGEYAYLHGAYLEVHWGDEK